MMPGNPAWTPEEDAILQERYHLERPAAVARRIARETGLQRSSNAVKIRAGKLGLDSRRSETDFGLAEAAELLGVSYHMVIHAAETGRIKLRGRGKSRFITLEEFAKLEALFPPQPARSMTKPEAMARLGYVCSHMSRLLTAGTIRGVKRGGRWYVDADHVEQLVAEMKATGEVRRSWGEHAGLEVFREKWRAEVSRHRSERRRAARREQWYTQLAAARVLGVGRDVMRRMLETGQVLGKRENGLWLVERAQVDGMARHAGFNAGS